jgi:hypothetical protein
MMNHKGVQPPNGKPFYLLCALIFLKIYPTEEVSRTLVVLDAKTWRYWTKVYINLLAYELDLVRSSHQLVIS